MISRTVINRTRHAYGTLVLDPTKNREFVVDPERALAGAGLTTEERCALTSGDASAISQLFDREGHYLRALVLIIVHAETETTKSLSE